jgi:uroporphyrinogen-III synthase
MASLPLGAAIGATGPRHTKLSARNTPDIGPGNDAAVLKGFTVGVTADRRWEEQASLFERRGATVQHGPSIRSLALGSDQRLRAATDSVIDRRPAALIANTGVGIRSWFSAADTWGLGEPLTDSLRGARVYARGPKAFSAVQLQGLDVEARAPTERLREAVDLALAGLREGDCVALQLDGRGSSSETERLLGSGVDVIEIPVYEWTLPKDTGPALRLVENVIAGKVHAVTFTAGPAVRNLLSIAAEHGMDIALRHALTEDCVVGCVGPVCADVAADEGVSSPNVVVPRTWRLGPLVRAVSERLAERTLVLESDHTVVTIAGNLVTVDATSIELTDTEAQLLTLLATQPNVVHAKSDLLRRVWRDETADPHVVEAVINRLRRRLGEFGSRITAVYRRGYTLRL